MATYLIINLLFLVVVIALFRIRPRRPTKARLATLIVLVVLTAVFDSFIVGFGMVAYDPAKILGITIGTAPVEDFFYAILAAILVPALWKGLEKKHGNN